MPRLTLAAALRRSGDPRAALDVAAPLLATLPASWGLHYECAIAHAALGQADAAADALIIATRLNPRSSLAWHALADQLDLLGHPDAASAASKARALPGGAGDAAVAEAAGRLFNGVPSATVDLHARFGFDPNDVAALRLLADVASSMGNDKAAEQLLAKALDLAPDFTPARYHLAAALFRLTRFAQALAFANRVVEERPAWAEARMLRAAILMRTGDARTALADFEASIVLAPDHAQAWHGYGHALRAVGRPAAAVNAYRQTITLAPTFTEAFWSLANLKTWRFEDRDVAHMTALMANTEIGGDERAYLHFALAKANEDAGRNDAAFEHYRQANALRRASQPHDAVAHSHFVGRMIETLTPGFLADRTGVGSKARGPIFVVGMPRSGSTLVEQILASHSQVEGLSELPEITAIAKEIDDQARSQKSETAYPEQLASLPDGAFTIFAADYLARAGLRRRTERPLFVDKFPGNFLHVGLIHLMLPNAVIIDVRRHPLSCCLSLFRQCFAGGQAYSYDLADLGRYFADYVALMNHIDAVLPGRVLRISYEALVMDVESETRRLLDHCGLPLEPGCLRFYENNRVVQTPSSEQVRRPIYQDALDRWRDFEPWLEPLITALGPLVDDDPVMGR